MVDFSQAELSKVIVHKLGSKTEDEGIIFSEDELSLQDGNLREVLLTYFLSSFKEHVFHNFVHDADINLNEIFSYSSKLFDDQSMLIEQSKNIAKHLYESSNHPKIKGGEFYVCILKNCMLDDEIADAIGIFKTENKDVYLKVNEINRAFDLKAEDGINIKKLDKGCLIFNTERNNGFISTIVDTVSKGKESARYWKEDFLGVQPREDDYFHTQNYMAVCKAFSEKGIEDIEKTDTIALKEETMSYFAQNENFSAKDYEEEVLVNPDAIEIFQDFKANYEEDHGIKLNDEFSVSENAVKENKKKFKSVLKLDKNFSVYVHGSPQLLVKGYSNEMNKHFYTLYFDEEK